MALILTLAIDQQAHDYFTALRNTHFPAWRNYLEAHITLFHQLPEADPFVIDTLRSAASREGFGIEVTGVHNIGNGVAFGLSSTQLEELHGEMQQKFAPLLISQDRKKRWPHITVQNKVTAFKALQTAQLLSQDFIPFTIHATGLHLWRYEKGPWRRLEYFPFLS